MLSNLFHKKGRNGLLGLASNEQEGIDRRARLLNRIFIVAAFAVMVVSITKLSHRDPVAEILESEIDGKLSSREIRAAFNFEAVDLELTRDAQNAAADEVPDYYRVDSQKVSDQLAELEEEIGWVESQRPAVRAMLFSALATLTEPEDRDNAVTKAVHQFAKGLLSSEGTQTVFSEHELALWLMPDRASLPEVIVERAEIPDGFPEATPVVRLEPDSPESLTYKTSDLYAQLARSGLEATLRVGIRQQTLLPQDSIRTIALLREAPDAGGQRSTESVYDAVRDPVAAGSDLAALLPGLAAGMADDDRIPALVDGASPVVAAFITDTLRHDKVETEGARERARSAVKPVLKEIDLGERIQDGGVHWTVQSRSDARTYLNLIQGDVNPLAHLISAGIAHLILVALSMLCLYRSIVLFRGERTASVMTLFRLALLLICGLLVISRIALYFEPSGFMVPVAACGILFAILVNSGLAAVVGNLAALLVSLQYGYDWRLLVVGTAMSMAGVFSIYRVRRRSDMASASITATMVGCAMMVAVILATDNLLDESTARRLILIVFNGIICALAVPAVLTPLERLFGITTDIQLLEYSDFNNELLSHLAVEAPGTSAHSRMLGDLAEVAAEAIGANGLLARVCALYHDIGKMRRSEYFSENQTGFNVHDELSPRMSARAIAAHVIQGAELAREHHLPKPIIDGILEHHGTCLIGYFYQQAVKEQKHGDVLEDDFRYPGPKPQRPETAILMICDAVESGVRSIKNPNEERVRDFVDKIVAARSADRQFDDCNLTLKQLDTISEVVAQRILSNQHTRVAYPAAQKEDNVDNVIPMTGAGE